MAESRKQQVVTAKEGEVQRMPRALSAFDEMDRVFDEFFGRGWLRPFRWERPSLFGEGAFAPKVDVLDRDDDVVVRAELPGVKKEDVEVSISGNMLTIKGETKHEEKEEKGDYYRAEMSRGAFSRTFSLPTEVDQARAAAAMKDGVLELTLPKIEKSKRRTIKID